jgi:hypothetical protein
MISPPQPQNLPSQAIAPKPRKRLQGATNRLIQALLSGYSRASQSKIVERIEITKLGRKVVQMSAQSLVVLSVLFLLTEVLVLALAFALYDPPIDYGGYAPPFTAEEIEVINATATSWATDE